jgi:flagellar protein FlbD
MIKVTRLNGRELTINPDLVEFLEATPETIISMTTGRKIVVREAIEEIVQRIIDFRHRSMPMVKPATN